MKSIVNLTSDNDLFSSTVINDVLVIREKQHILHMTQDINAIFSFYEYLDSMLTNKAYKALVVFGQHESVGNDERMIKSEVPVKRPYLAQVNDLVGARRIDLRHKPFGDVPPKRESKAEQVD